jgi:hypothetical protein
MVVAMKRAIEGIVPLPRTEENVSGKDQPNNAKD